MRIKRTLFFSLILFLIIFSISFVSASENITNDAYANELSAVSVSADMQNDECISDVCLDSEDNQNLDEVSLSSNEESSTSNTDLKDGTSNVDEIDEDELSLTENDEGLSSESDEYLPDNGKVPTLQANPLGADHELSGGTAQQVMNMIQQISNEGGGTLYLNGGTYTSTGDITANQNQIINISNVRVVGGSRTNPNLIARFQPGGTDSTSLTFRGSTINYQGAQRYVSTSGVNLNNVTFENLNCTGRFFNFVSGSMTDCVFNNLESYQHLFFVTGAYADSVPYRLTNCNFTNSKQTYVGDSPVGGTDGTGQFGVVFGAEMYGCNFINTSSATHGGAFCLSDEYPGAACVASKLVDCNFINITSRWFAVYIHGNYTNSPRTITEPQVLDNCKFINCTGEGEYGGALGISHNNVIINNSEFTHNTGGEGSAIMVGGIEYLHDGFLGNNTEGNNITIDNCIFKDNVAKTEGQTSSTSYDPYSVTSPTGYAGAVFVYGNDTNIFDSIFVNNTAVDSCGAAVYILGQNTTVVGSEFYDHHSANGTIYLVGDDCEIRDSSFHDNNATSTGSCIYILGNSAGIGNTTFVNNTAPNGGCIFIQGNRTVIDNDTKFISNNATNGAGVYIIGDHTNITNTSFVNNTAENGSGAYLNGHDVDILKSVFEGNNATNGGGVFIEGDISIIDNNTFYKNNVTNQGGAVYIDGHQSIIRGNNFTANEAVPLSEDEETGLGGAIFVHGDDTNTISNQFYHNKARNGSAIYTDGTNFNLTNDVFFENQAWSYVLVVTAVPPESLYNTEDINITVTHRGGDNIINAIHNRNQDPTQLKFLNVTYQHSSGSTITTDPNNQVSPVLGVENSQNGTLLYQDDREDQQRIQLFVTHENGQQIYNNTNLITDLYGNVNVTINRTSLRKGKYIVDAEHVEDWNYKFIYNATTFRILDSMDVSVNKTSDEDEYFQDEIAEWEIIVHNVANGTDAEDVTITDFLPDTFRLLNLNYTLYNGTDDAWTKGILYLNNSTVSYGVYNASGGNWIYGDANYDASSNTWTYYFVELDGDTIVYTVFNADDFVDRFGDVTYSNSTDICYANISYNIPEEDWYYDTITVDGQEIRYGHFNETYFTQYFGDVHYDDENITWVYVRQSIDPETGDPVELYTYYNITTGYWVIDSQVYAPERKTVTQRISLTIDNDTANNRTNIALFIKDFDKSDTGVIDFETNCTKAGTYNNIVNVTTPDFDWDLSNNEDNKTVLVDPLPNKTVSNSTPYYGDFVEYNLTIKNTGNETYTQNLTVIDSLPEGLEYNETVAIIGADQVGQTVVNGQTVTWVVTNITGFTNATIIVKVRVHALGNLTNNMTLIAPSGFNRTVNATITPVPYTDVSVNKTSDKPSYFVDDIVTWTITVSVAGNGSNATNVRLYDVLPAEVEFINYTALNGTYDNGTGIWTIGFMENGTSTTLTILSLAIQSKENITNVANVSCDEDEWDYTNNIDNATINLYPNINKTVNQTEFDYFQEVEYNLTVMNTGNVTYNGTLTLIDILPEGVTFLEVVSITGLKVVSFDNTTKNLTWVVTNITANTNATIIIRARCDAIGLQNNTWKINTPDGLTKNVSVPIVVSPNVDLSVNKTSDKPSYFVDDIVTWTITVHNAGNGTNATNVRLRDILPAEVEFINYTALNGTYDNGTGIWTIGFMGNGTSTTLTILSRAIQSKENITNVANVSCDEVEWDYTNNIDNATINLYPNINKTVNQTEFDYHKEVEYNLTVMNTGNVTYNGTLTLIDILPEGVTFLEVVSITGLKVVSFDNTTKNLTWVVTNITANTNATIIIRARCDAIGLQNNTWKINTPDGLTKNVSVPITVNPLADVSINKTVDKDLYHIGETVIWTITVTNAANGTNATGVNVRDILPAEVEFVSATGGTYDNGTGIWTIGFMGNGTSQTLVIESIARINKTDITNIANVSCNEKEWDYTNNIDNATIDIVDTPIYKTSDKDRVLYGDTVEFYLSVENIGDEDWNETLTLIDRLPDGLEFIRVISTTGLTVISFDNTTQNLTWIVKDIPAKTKANITILVRALVLGDPDNPFNVLGPNLNETVNKTIHVDPVVDLSIVKTADKEVYHINDTVTWTITVYNANNGTNATGVNVRDILPVEVEFVSATGGTYDNESGIWTIGFMGNGTNQTLVVKSIARINKTDITNVANVSCNEEEWDYTNNIDNATISIEDIPVNKTSNRDNFKYGETVEYYLSVTNLANETWNETVTLVDELPTGLKFVEIVGYDNCVMVSNDTSTQRLTFVVTNITANETATITIKVELLAVGDIDNPLNVSGENFHKDVNKTIHVDPVVDLSIVKTADKEVYHINDTVTWTITVYNANNGTNATGVNVSDILPVEVEFVSATGGTYDNESGIWTIGFMGNGTNQTLVVKSIARINKTDITNVANVSCNEEEWDYTNNIDNATISIEDIPVNKTSNRDNFKYGETVEYYLSVTNLANETWNETVTLVDELPTGLKFVEIVGYDNCVMVSNDTSTQRLTFVVTNITAYETATITIKVELLAVGDIDNPLNVSGENFHKDVNKTIHVDPVVDLSIVKTADREVYHINDTVIWTITVSNAANGTNATGVNVSDILPVEVEFVSATGGTYDNDSGIWTIGFMGNGTNQTLVVKSIARINKTDITNVANVSCNEEEWDYTNNIDNATINVEDIPVNKTSNRDNFKYGETVEYYLSVTNLANETWNETVTLVDELPAGLKFVEIVGYDNCVMVSNDTSTQRLTFVVTNITAYETATITIKVELLAVGDIDNPLNVSGENFHKDVNKTIHVDPVVDLSIVKTADREVYHINDTVIWTITVSNAWNGTNATGVNVSDILPVEVEFVSATGGTYDNDSGIWTIGFMGNGTNQTLVVKSIARINKTDITNVANVSCNEEEWDYTNNIDNATINVEDIPVNKTSNRDNFKYGETVEYYLSVTNLANETWNETVTLVDELPTGLKFVEIVGYDNCVMISNDTSTQRLTFVVTNITANETATITIKVELLVVGDVDNPLNVSGENFHKDVNKTIHVDPIVDVSITKTADGEIYHIGDYVTWTITVSNAANGTNATGVTVKDILPVEVEFVSATGGTYDNGTGIWTIGFMGNGTSQTLVVKSIARINKTDITNIANVSCNEEEWNYTNNIDNATINIVGVPINKTSDKDSVMYGDTVEYYLIVENLANETWTKNLTLIDVLPNGLEFIRVVSQTGLTVLDFKNETQTLTWNVTNIEAKTNATITILVKALALGDPDNPFTVTGENIHETVNKTIHVDPIVDVSVKKTSDKNEYFVDGIAIWTITVSNANNGTNATNVRLSDLLPKEFGFINYTASKGTYDSTNGVWTIGFMKNGTSEKLVIRSYAKTKANNVTNVANVSCDEKEWNYTNNIANKTVKIYDIPDLNKTVNNSRPYYNDTVVYSLKIKNVGNVTYTDNLLVIDSMPNGLKYLKTVSISGAKLVKEVVDGQKITWTITNIPAKSTAVIKVKVKVLALGNLTNNLTIIGPRGTNKTVNCTIDPIPWADLAVVKTSDHFGIDCHNDTTVVWTIKVTNYGPNTAVNSIAKDILPAGLVYISDDTNGKYDSETGIWTIGDLKKGKSVVMHITTKVDAIDTVINNPVVVSSDTRDPDKSNNRDNSSIKVISVADLELIKESNVTKVKVKENFTYLITVINHGPDTAINARAFDKLPKGLKLLGFEASKGDYDPESGKWSIGDLKKGEKVTLRIDVMALVEGNVINEARVESDTFDNDTSNNNDSVTVVVVDDHIPMRHTGNPFMVCLLSLIAIVGIPLRRKI